MGSIEITPGLIVVQGNQPEALRDVLLTWLKRYPLSPLENETILVQSNGIAQWLKLALAQDESAGGCGIAAALDIGLPARFLWKSYRGVLGHAVVPETSPLDKAAMVWRLMRLLPTLLEKPAFQALRRFLSNDADMRKRHQLAERLADIFDQYQVYRADWIHDWSNRDDQLKAVNGGIDALGADDLWQAELWRTLVQDVGPEGLRGSRADVHRRFLARLSDPGGVKGLPRRVVIFGISSMPAQTLEALAALSRFAQVLLCVHNPCKHHWADIVSDKDMHRLAYKRQAHRPGTPKILDENLLHHYAHPLLAAWGKQGRDYISLLDGFDDPDSYRSLFKPVNGGRIDLFSEDTPVTLLGQLQDDILELRTLDETRNEWAAVDVRSDRSIRFHVVHSPQREIEVLHDQLLARFDASPQLLPRDVIVMLPDIDIYAPHIAAVFGQLHGEDPRFIPYTLADQGSRGRQPLLIALELLLKLPESRFAVSEILDLLDVAALRARFGIDETDLPLLHRWINGAGIRWGMNASHRENLGLPAVDEVNTWRFGLRRMLLGFAVGEGEVFDGINPYSEIGGLDAAIVGKLAALLRGLSLAGEELRIAATPVDWGNRLRRLLNDFFLVTDQGDELLQANLLQLLEQWLDACEAAGFVEPIPLSVVREAWLAALDDKGLNQRFLAGSVNFCTLMPMRAIPFKVVCLLGMNDGDYPRRQPPLDFDLMRNEYRPGDRSRREDDRYLLLEAMLSAREQLYVSWVGRSARDNSARPPSVLIGQLRDHLAAGWRLDGDVSTGSALLDALTQEHPLQPFSRRYFSDASGASGVDGLFTYAGEWRSVHDSVEPRAPDDGSLLVPIPAVTSLNLKTLEEFLANPVKAFFQNRLKVYFGKDLLAANDEEAFMPDALQRWQFQNELCEKLRPWVESEWDIDSFAGLLQRALNALQSEGRLPLASFGSFTASELGEPLADLMGRYREEWERWSKPDDSQHELSFQSDTEGVALNDWLHGRRQHIDGRVAVLRLVSGKLHRGKDIKWSGLIRHWVHHLAHQVEGSAVATVLVSQTGNIEIPALPAREACQYLNQIVEAYCEGMRRPLPLACKAAFAWLSGDGDNNAAKTCYDGGWDQDGEAKQSPALQRAYSDFAALAGRDVTSSEFSVWANKLYGPLVNTVRRRSVKENA